MTNLFRTVALVLRDHVSGTYDLLAATDAVVNVVEADAERRAETTRPSILSPDKAAVYNWSNGLWDYNHGFLVEFARKDDEVLMHLAASKKINAIKRLRTAVPGAGLKACKEAVEDSLVEAAAALRSDPWAMPRNEPPF